MAELSSHWGRMLARVQVDPDQRPGSLFVPMHWSDATGRSARANALVNPALDPISGQPEFKHTPVRVGLLQARWYGFALTREQVDLPEPAYCVAVRRDGYWRTEIAGAEGVSDWAAWARRHLGQEGEWLDFADPSHGRYRGARILDGRLAGCLFVAAAPDLPRSAWLGGLFNVGALDAGARASLLAGRPPRVQKDPGETVCACFNVGRNSILDAIRSAGASTVDAIGAALQAGTGCGSCLPEISRLLQKERSPVAA